jgi:hypothetical protein
LETNKETTIASTSSSRIISTTHYLTTPSTSTKVDTTVDTDSKIKIKTVSRCGVNIAWKTYC